MSRLDNISEMKISEIEYPIYNALAQALEHQQAWRKVLDYVRQKNNKFELSGSIYDSPSRKLLTAFDNWGGNLGLFTTILNECKLYDVLSILVYERMVINKQPNHGLFDNTLSIKRNEPLTLTFDVHGLPVPQFIWFRNNRRIPDQKNCALFYEHFTTDLEGEYYCIATQLEDDEEVESLRSAKVKVQLFPERCVVLKKPLPKLCKREGESFSLKVKVSGYPEPKYEWSHNNTILNIDGNELFKLVSNFHDTGKYRCRIWNPANEIIVETQLTILDSQSLFTIHTNPVSEKVALLIGNQNYAHHSQLKTPIHDIDALQTILEELGFLVIKKNNLDKARMKKLLEYFCEMLVEDAYVIVYFAGHGFELGEKYLLPIDAPATSQYSVNDCIADSQILRDVLRTKPALFLLMLDMCLETPSRKENEAIYLEPKETYEYGTDRNLIQACATSSRLKAYEIGQRNTEYNSVYMRSLKTHLLQNLSLLKILANVSRDVEEVEKSFGQDYVKQMPLLTFNVTQDFLLNAPKQGNRRTQEMCRNIMSHQ